MNQKSHKKLKRKKGNSGYRKIAILLIFPFLLLLHVTVPWGCKIHPVSLWPETNQKVEKNRNEMRDSEDGNEYFLLPLSFFFEMKEEE